MLRTPVWCRFTAALAALMTLGLSMALALWLLADRDLAYLVRVLIHRGSSTSDFHWKRSAAVLPATGASNWPQILGCAGVAADFAKQDRGQLTSYLERSGALSFVVIQNGVMICEWYGNSGSRAGAAAAFSISKTVLALLLARAVERGTVSYSDPVTRYLPELAQRDPRFSEITLAHLIDMRSGLSFSEATRFPWVNQDAPAVYFASDLAQTALTRPRIEQPPGPFLYNDYLPNLLGLVLERTSGSRLAPGPMQALWSELGAQDPAAWSVDDHGFAWHESGLIVTARDLARFGQLMLSGGWVGERVVAPAAFLIRSTEAPGLRPVVNWDHTALGYRNGWWTLPRRTGSADLLALGRHGQVMLVSRSTRTVIVRMGRSDTNIAESNISIARRLQALTEH